MSREHWRGLPVWDVLQLTFHDRVKLAIGSRSELRLEETRRDAAKFSHCSAVESIPDLPVDPNTQGGKTRGHETSHVRLGSLGLGIRELANGAVLWLSESLTRRTYRLRNTVAREVMLQMLGSFDALKRGMNLTAR